MSQQAVEQLLDRWVNDPSFRTALRADPEGTVKGAGVALSEEEWAAFRAVDWSLDDEELTARANVG